LTFDDTPHETFALHQNKQPKTDTSLLNILSIFQGFLLIGFEFYSSVMQRWRIPQSALSPLEKHHAFQQTESSVGSSLDAVHLDAVPSLLLPLLVPGLPMLTVAIKVAATEAVPYTTR